MKDKNVDPRLSRQIYWRYPKRIRPAHPIWPHRNVSSRVVVAFLVVLMFCLGLISFMERIINTDAGCFQNKGDCCWITRPSELKKVKQYWGKSVELPRKRPARISKYTKTGLKIVLKTTKIWRINNNVITKLVLSRYAN